MVATDITTVRDLHRMAYKKRKLSDRDFATSMNEFLSHAVDAAVKKTWVDPATHLLVPVTIEREPDSPWVRFQIVPRGGGGCVVTVSHVVVTTMEMILPPSTFLCVGDRVVSINGVDVATMGRDEVNFIACF